MKYFLFLVLLAPISFFAQVSESDEVSSNCHMYEMQDALFDAHPELRIEAEQAAALLEDFTRNFDHQAASRDGEPYTIPVVFHIVHYFGNENISNEQVQDCIRVLNEDFSASNSGAANVNPAFQNLVADVGIQFRLAQIDPNGECTNGIVRTVSPLTSSGGENLKTISPIWDRSKYMNVWVCKTIESGAAGYTYYPSTLAGLFGLTNDGIVVRSDYVGAIGTSSPQRSHTMTHEVGHWLNLPHLWGSSNTPGLASNCNMDDGVSDTPNTAGWTSCNINGSTCGSLDNVENYMEYSPCSKMFTLGQGERMIAALNSSVASRSSLWQPENLEETGVNIDGVLCNADFAASVRIACVGETITFTDFSHNDVQSREWNFPGGLPEASDLASPLVIYNEPGIYPVSLIVSDGTNSLTEEKVDYIRIIDTALVVSPFQEDFESYVAFNELEDDHWFTDNLNGEIDWEITSAAAYSGTKSAYVNGRQNQSGEVEYLLSQTFALNEVQGNSAVLTFKYAHARRNFNSDDQLRVFISRDCGNTWSLRRVLSGDDLPTVAQSVPGTFVPSGLQDWREEVVTGIISVFLTNEFRVRFEFTSNSGNNLYIDDINIQDASLISSIDETDLMDQGVSLYPNPTGDVAFLEFDQQNVDRGSIFLLDLSGRQVKEVFSGTLNSGPQRHEIYCGDLPSGIYFVRIETNGGGVYTSKIVVQ
jgi:PKD repeat protein